MKLTDEFYINKPEPQQSCFLAIRSFILNFDSEFTETIKYKMPCFLYKKKIFCYLWKDKDTNEPYVLVANGNYIEHSKLESGSRKRMKIFRINPQHDLPLEDLNFIFSELIKFEK